MNQMKMNMNNKFNHRFSQYTYPTDIDKENLNLLPKASFKGKIVVVDTKSKTDSAVKVLSEHNLLGLDTETKPSFIPGKKTKVALLQLSTLDTCFLFRINKLGIPESLKQLLEREDILKVGLSLRDDLSGLKRIESFEANGYIELQQIVPAYGIRCSSLQKIYAIIQGKYLSKSQRMTNWEAPVLTDKQQEYAALDAQACIEIYNSLMALAPPHPAQFGFIYL